MLAYLDIETSFDGRVTVVGVLVRDGLVQLVGDAIDAESVGASLEGVDEICTYFGDRFDLPVLGAATGIDLLAGFRSLDLYLECRRRRVRGGLKAVERRYAIPRRLRGVSGYDAMGLWQRWEEGDREALDTLLTYNGEDVTNLATLERRLRGDLELPGAPARTIVGA